MDALYPAARSDENEVDFFGPTEVSKHITLDHACMQIVYHHHC